MSKSRRKPQCRWICRNGAGSPSYTNCALDSGHGREHRTHGGHGKGWTWELGPHIKRGGIVRAKLIWLNPNLSQPPQGDTEGGGGGR
jgi:hypothetical protein